MSPEIGRDVRRAQACLEAGELVGIPTETVYGLAANALDVKAIDDIFRAKGRPRNNPLILHVASLEAAKPYLASVPQVAARLAETFWPGPLTMLLPRSAKVPDIVTNGNARVALRIPRHPLTLELLEALGTPLVAPSANPSGYVSPTSAQHVADQLGDKLGYILDGGPCEVGIESTIVGFEDNRIVIHRPGRITAKELMAFGPVVRAQLSAEPQAPGQLPSHYAPQTRLLLGDPSELIRGHNPKEVGVLSFAQTLAEVPENQQVRLSQTGNLEEVARHLYAGLRYLDTLKLSVLLCEEPQGEGLAEALRDRLQRASAR